MSLINWKTLFFSADGRLARAPFWIAAAILVGALTLYEAATGPTLRLMTGWFVYPILIFFAVCVLSKRLHDRGRSGWYAAAIILAIVAVWPWPRGLLDFLFAVLIVWSVVELGGMTGEQGTNRFGASPVRQPYG